MVLVVSPAGTVRHATLGRHGGAMFQEAMTAARQWRFTPATAGGDPRDSVAGVVVRFTLH